MTYNCKHVNTRELTFFVGINKFSIGVIGSTLGVIISTIVSVIVTSLVCLLITQKRIQQYKALPEHKLQDPVIKTGPVYDVPDMNIKPVQDTFELQTNTAYGTVMQ